MIKYKVKYTYRHGGWYRDIKYSNKEVLKNIMFWPMLASLSIGMIFDNIFYGVVFGIVILVIYLNDAFEKDD